MPQDQAKRRKTSPAQGQCCKQERRATEKSGSLNEGGKSAKARR